MLLVHSSLLGYERTAELLAAGDLEVDIAARERGPLGPLMNGRRAHLEAEGLLAPGQDHEDVLVVRGRKSTVRTLKAPAASVRIRSMARSIWSGAISFGLVNVPIKLYSAVSRKTVRFNQLNSETGNRIARSGRIRRPVTRCPSTRSSRASS